MDRRESLSMITGIEHLAIAVPDLERAIRRFADDFGCAFEGIEAVEAAVTTTAFFAEQAVKLELVHPLDGKGPIARYLEKRQGGLHHICFRSDDIEADIAMLKDKGYEFISETPTPGAHGCRTAFIHPKSCDGLLVEISEPASQ